MRQHHLTRPIRFLTLLAALVVAAEAGVMQNIYAGSHSLAGPPAELLVGGLEGGSGSAIGPGGALYVTEAHAGRISRVDPQSGRVTTFVSGLPKQMRGFPVGGVEDQALQFFRNLPVREGPGILRMLRPPTGVSALARALALADVPPESVVTPNRQERRQLTALARVLAYHELQDEFAVRVVDAPPAVVALHARAVLLVTRPALQLLSDTELQATVAHEVGHNDFWWEYKSARERGDVEGLQLVELKCDAVAAFTLTALDLNPESLYQAVVKMVTFNGVSRNAWERTDIPVQRTDDGLYRRFFNRHPGNRNRSFGDRRP